MFGWSNIPANEICLEKSVQFCSKDLSATLDYKLHYIIKEMRKLKKGIKREDIFLPCNEVIIDQQLLPKRLVSTLWGDAQGE